MLNNGAKWYNFSPPRWSFIAPPLTTIVVLLTSELSLIDDKDDTVVCLYTVLSYTTLRDTTLFACRRPISEANSEASTASRSR